MDIASGCGDGLEVPCPSGCGWALLVVDASPDVAMLWARGSLEEGRTGVVS